MQNQDTFPSSGELAVVWERLKSMADGMEAINRRLDHMATTEQVKQLVGRGEFDRLKWELDQHKDYTAREVSDLKKQADARSWRVIVGNITLIAAAGSSVLALVVALTGWRP